MLDMVEDQNGLPTDDDIKARFERIRDELKDLTVTELHEDQIAEKANNLPKNVMPEVPEFEFTRPEVPGMRRPGQKSEEATYLGLGVGLSVAYSLSGCILGGWGIGKLIDMKVGGTAGQLFGALLGSVIGLAASIFTIMKAQKS